MARLAPGSVLREKVFCRVCYCFCGPDRSSPGEVAAAAAGDDGLSFSAERGLLSARSNGCGFSSSYLSSAAAESGLEGSDTGSPDSFASASSDPRIGASLDRGERGSGASFSLLSLLLPWGEMNSPLSRRRMILLHLLRLLRLRGRVVPPVAAGGRSSLWRCCGCADTRLPRSDSLVSVMLPRVGVEGVEAFGEEVGEFFFSCHSLRFSLAQEPQELR